MGAGRPPMYKTAKDMQRLIDLYFLACTVHQEIKGDYGLGHERLTGLSDEDLDIVNDVTDVYPTISGLAYTLGFSTEALRNYEQKDEFLVTIKRAKQRVEMSLEQRLASPAVTGSIFSLKNNFGWKDKAEIEHSGNIGLTQILESISDDKDGLPSPK